MRTSLAPRIVLALSLALSGLTLVAPPAAAEPCPDGTCNPCPDFDCLVCPGGGCTPPPCDVAPCPPCLETGCEIQICVARSCYVSDDCSASSCCVVDLCWYSVCNTMECPTPAPLCEKAGIDCGVPPTLPHCPGECWPPVPIPPCGRLCGAIPDPVCVGRLFCL